MLLPTLAVLIQPWLKPELQKILCIIQKKMEQNEDGRYRYPRLLQTMTAFQPKFHGVTLACDDSLTIQAHKVMLVDISTVSGGLLRNQPEPYPLVYVRGGGDQHPVLRQKGIDDQPYENKIDSKERTNRQYSLGLRQVWKTC